MKILVATNKYDTQYFRWSNPNEQAASALALFKLNDGLSYYDDISDPNFAFMESTIEELKAEIEKSIKADISDNYIAKLRTKLAAYQRQLKDDKVQSDLYASAIQGNADSALKLINLRKDAEYEGWTLAEVK